MTEGPTAIRFDAADDDDRLTTFPFAPLTTHCRSRHCTLPRTHDGSWCSYHTARPVPAGRPEGDMLPPASRLLLRLDPFPSFIPSPISIPIPLPLPGEPIAWLHSLCSALCSVNAPPSHPHPHSPISIPNSIRRFHAAPIFAVRVSPFGAVPSTLPYPPPPSPMDPHRPPHSSLPRHPPRGFK
jgi:hypothetical protein